MLFYLPPASFRARAAILKAAAAPLKDDEGETREKEDVEFLPGLDLIFECPLGLRYLVTITFIRETLAFVVRLVLLVLGFSVHRSYQLLSLGENVLILEQYVAGRHRR